MLLVLAVTGSLCVPAIAAPEANTCNGESELGYPLAPNFNEVGDIVHVVLTLGAGGIQGGTTLSINRVRFNLDCDSTAALDINCLDEGEIISYQGNLSSDCPTGFTASHGDGDTLPNQVVFTPGSPILVPADDDDFCTLEFDVQIETVPTADSSPGAIEQVSGFDSSQGDGVCDTVPALAAGNTNSGSLGVCVCDDGDLCTDDTCDPSTGCVFTDNSDRCDDSDVCTDDSCDPIIGCVNTDNSARCDDSDVCTDDSCDPVIGCVNTDNSARCDDSDVCTDDSCDPVTGCVNTDNSTRCDDNDVCTDDSCDPVAGCVNTDNSARCDDSDVCTDDSCDPIDGCVNSDNSARCDDENVCTDDTCDPVDGCVNTDNSDRCDDGDTCTDDSCDPEEGCINEPNGNTECSLPCRITGGGIVFEDTGNGGEPEARTDPNLLAEIQRATFGGQVGAPFGIVGCHDDFDQIQGQWTHLRHKRRGSFHASDYNSLVCGCDSGDGAGFGGLDGTLCNPGDDETGPEPRPAPANIACFTGVGNYARNGGRRTVQVAFRVEVEDRGEPGAGRNAGNLEDVYRIRIWIPTNQEDVNDLAAAACCTIPNPDIRTPDVTDGGNLIHGNLQIHPATGNPNNQ